MNDNKEIKQPDNGSMPRSVANLSEAIVGHKIIKAEIVDAEKAWDSETLWGDQVRHLKLTLDEGKEVIMKGGTDCCAHTTVEKFVLNAEKIDHVIMSVDTTEHYNKWHIYADYGQIMELEIGWSSGNPFYYGYGFEISVKQPTSDD